MPIEIDGRLYYRTAEVYRDLGISRNTLYRWLQKNILGTTEHRDVRGWRLFTIDEIDAMKKAMNQVVKIEHPNEKQKNP